MGLEEWWKCQMNKIVKKIISAQDKFHHWWLNVLWRLSGKDAPMVLLFHEILPEGSKAENDMQVSASSFERLLTNMLNDGWKALSEDELIKMVENRRWRKKCFFVTFDDAHESVYEVAYPILQKLQIPFTVFLTNELIDKPNYLNVEQVKQMACSVGGHGEHHVAFRRLNTDSSIREYDNNKGCLENIFEKQINLFAFPFGGIKEVSRDNVRLLKNRFKLGFSTYEGTLMSMWWTGQYFLPRVNVSEELISAWCKSV
jgi:peptidoglycan/xylan/chitin deacetylase (PgdA/CDA1 family)